MKKKPAKSKKEKVIVELPPTPRKGAWEVAREKGHTPGTPKSKTGRSALRYSEEVIVEMAKDKAGGMSNEDIAEKYSATEAYVKHALRQLYINTSIGREILKGVLLENSIALGMQVRAKMPELNAMQTVVAAGVMTSRFIELDKHTQGAAPDVPYADIAAAVDKIDAIVQEVGELALPESSPSVFDSEGGMDEDSTQPTED